ncbi:MAG: hypothetical protein HUU22_18915 [Phycisphaerae bacterium]|nr:hypothetical protein [Phycisphaerae bacterium]NUQ48090.1 hypothetical protein [Phycisphaerae bacterium]
MDQTIVPSSGTGETTAWMRSLAWAQVGNSLPSNSTAKVGQGPSRSTTACDPPPSYLCFYDANGNLSETIKNSDGTLWSHHDYDPWGNQLVMYESAGIAHPFRYSTKYSDRLFEKQYFGNRFSDNRYGRWASRDPLTESGWQRLGGVYPQRLASTMLYGYLVFHTK